MNICLKTVTICSALALNLGVAMLSAQVQSISTVELEKLRRMNSVLVVDVRATDAYRAGHIAGAISVPLTMLPNRLVELASEPRLIVFYCACVADASSHKAAEQLFGESSKSLTGVLRGGWSAWSAAGLETRSGPLP